MASACPINGDNHRYFVFKTFTEFEPYVFPEVDEPETAEYLQSQPQLYRKVEYAVVGCNCSSVIKTEVKDFQYGEK